VPCRSTEKAEIVQSFVAPRKVKPMALMIAYFGSGPEVHSARCRQNKGMIAAAGPGALIGGGEQRKRLKMRRERTPWPSLWHAR
jgi:hypothetical protein